ncbi:MAG: CatA-like O-acetyltransferase [Bacteroidota bacterium]
MKDFDINSWNRKTQYEFFKSYDDPFFNLTTNLNVTNLYKYCKNNDISFFLACLHLALESANEITEFRLRIIDDQVYVFDSIDIGSTVLNEDKSFSFCYFQRKDSIVEFNVSGKEILENHHKENRFDANENNEALIHCSFIPWFSFTSMKHARDKEMEKNGIPKFVFGKYFVENNIKKMPFSIEAHHALMDGYHVGKFIQSFQERIDNL